MSKRLYTKLVGIASQTEVFAAQLWGQDPGKCIRYYRGAAVAWEEAERHASSFYEGHICRRHADSCRSAKGS